MEAQINGLQVVLLLCSWHNRKILSNRLFSDDTYIVQWSNYGSSSKCHYDSHASFWCGLITFFHFFQVKKEANEEPRRLAILVIVLCGQLVLLLLSMNQY